MHFLQLEDIIRPHDLHQCDHSNPNCTISHQHFLPSRLIFNNNNSIFFFGYDSKNHFWFLEFVVDSAY